MKKCYECDGTGRLTVDHECPVCNGTGNTEEQTYNKYGSDGINEER